MDPLVFTLNPWVDLSRRDAGAQRFFGWFDRTLLAFVGNACNLRCAYCFKPRDAEPLLAVADIDEQLRRGAAYGCRHVIFTGGEPLVHPELDRVVALARERGFPSFGLQTNALKLADGARVDQLVAAGLGFCHVSLDSPDAATQDALAGHARTFESAVAALEHLARHPQVVVHVKAVITSRNEDQLDALVDLFADLARRTSLRAALTLTPMVPPANEYDELLVRYPAVAPALASALERGRAAGLPVYYHHLPPCLMGGRAEASIDWHVRDDVLRADGTLGADSMYARSPRCEACPQGAACPGFPRAYADLFGDEAFTPPGAAPSPRPLAPPRGPSSPAARLVVTSWRDGVRRPFSWRNVAERIPQLLAQARGRVIITGAEPLAHPALPQIVSLLAGHGLSVWLETLGLGFTRPEPIATLVERGLAGVRWLHLAPDSPAYLDFIGRPLPDGFDARVGVLLAKAGVPVEHVFLDGEAPATVRRRVEQLAAQPFQRARPGRCVGSAVPLEERWSAWLGLGPAGAGHPPELAGLLEHEARDAFRTVVPGLE